MGSGATTPRILSLGTWLKWVSSFTPLYPRVEPPVPIG